MTMNMLKKVVEDIGSIEIIPEQPLVSKLDRYIQANQESTGHVSKPNIFETTEVETKIIEKHIKEASFADKSQLNQIITKHMNDKESHV